MARMRRPRFHVVKDDCEVSFVSIEHFATGSAIVDTDHSAGVKKFNASDTRYTLTVKLKCGTNSATDLVLGPPELFPPAEFDLHATPFASTARPAEAAAAEAAARRRRRRTVEAEAAADGGGGGGTGGGGGGTGVAEAARVVAAARPACPI